MKETKTNERTTNSCRQEGCWISSVHIWNLMLLLCTRNYQVSFTFVFRVPFCCWKMPLVLLLLLVLDAGDCPSDLADGWPGWDTKLTRTRKWQRPCRECICKYIRVSGQDEYVSSGIQPYTDKNLPTALARVNHIPNKPQQKALAESPPPKSQQMPRASRGTCLFEF